MTKPSWTLDEVSMEGDGVSLPARYYEPAERSSSPRPAIIVTLGGIQKGIFLSGAWLAERLAGAGFAAFMITWRNGSPIDDPKDVGLAIDWLQRRAGVDSNRIGIMGQSRGGMSALRSCALDKRLRAVATFGAPTDMIQNVRAAEAYAPGRYETLVKWLGGTPDDNRAFYDEIQAISHADRITQPVLLIHGGFDMHIPPEHAAWMQRELARHGNKQATVEIIPGMSHYGDMIPQYVFGFDEVAAPAVAFFRKVLDGAST